MTVVEFFRYLATKEETGELAGELAFVYLRALDRIPLPGPRAA